MYEALSRIIHLKDYNGEDPIYLAESVYREGRRIPLHAHDFYELALVLDGRLTHDYNGVKSSLPKGHLQLIHPLDVHTYEGDYKGESRLLNFAFTEAVYRQLCSGLGLNAIEKGFSHLREGQIEELQRRLTIEAQSEKLVYQVLLGLVLDFHFQRDLSPDQDKVLIPIWLKEAMKAMTEPNNLRLGLDRFVELSGKSKEHLFRSLKHYFGVPAGRWVNEHRLEYARRLIRTTDQPILNIVYEVGFNSESYFYRLYKGYFGLRPKEDRQEVVSRK